MHIKSVVSSTRPEGHPGGQRKRYDEGPTFTDETGRVHSRDLTFNIEFSERTVR